MSDTAQHSTDSPPLEHSLVNDLLLESGHETLVGEGGYQVVARRYRPQGFQTLIGQDHVARALINAITTHRVGHAYLFTGARGVGKTSTARIFAKALECEKGPTPTPCNECEICRGITAGDDIDVLEIDGASNRGIREIRALREGATIRPTRTRYKIYIIDEVHMLTNEAFNALLKTLEEPPPHVKFIFCTTEPAKLPITILSRCQRFDFAGIGTSMIAAHLERILARENVLADGGVCETIARRANGSMRDAQSLLEQLLAFASNPIHLADVHAMLGSVDDSIVYALLNAIQNESATELFPVLNRAAEAGSDFGVLCEQMLGVFRDLLALAGGCGASELLYTSLDRLDELSGIASALGVGRILASMQVLDQTIARMRYSTQGRILAELAFVRLATFGGLERIATLVEELKSGKLGSLAISSLTTGQGGISSGAALSAPGSARAISETQPPSPEKKTADSAPLRPVTPTHRMGSDTGTTAKGSSPLSESSRPHRLPRDVQLSPDEAARIWREATRPLGAMLSSHAGSFCAAEWIPPNRLRIGFPVSLPATRKYCQNESARLIEALEPFFAEPVRLEWDSVGDEPAPNISAPPAVSPQRQRLDLMRRTHDHPMVAEAAKLFGVELTDVKTDFTP